MYAQGKLTRFRPLFSGKNSKRLWRDINRVKPRRASDALYALACKCQQLEDVVMHLEERLAALEKESRYP